jgi:NTP pyrophosphatase (non-canonical NTP hydrolase)
VSREIEELQAALRRFAAERDWGQFHTPKNLAASLSIEAAEVLEHFQWLTDGQSRQLTGKQRQQAGHEIADVLLYPLQLSDRLGIDPLEPARRKLAINAAKYPADKAHGSSRKYIES